MMDGQTHTLARARIFVQDFAHTLARARIFVQDFVRLRSIILYAFAFQHTAFNTQESEACSIAKTFLNTHVAQQPVYSTYRRVEVIGRERAWVRAGARASVCARICARACVFACACVRANVPASARAGPRVRACLFPRACALSPSRVQVRATFIYNYNYI